MSQSDQDLIEDLQMRIAFLEQTVDDLNEVVVKQQKEMNLLGQAIKHLNSRLNQLGGPNIRSQEDETPPPHY